MNLLPKYKMKTVAVFILSILLLFFACSNSPVQQTLPDKPAPSETVVTPSDNSSVIQTENQSQDLVNRLDVVYFHRPQRCPTCLCFEERIRYVMGTYFQAELDSGKITFGVYNIGDSKNADIVKKYGAISSQLFINTVKNGTDNIKDIQDIWSWNCRFNKPAFDQQVKNVIQQGLEAIE